MVSFDFILQAHTHGAMAPDKEADNDHWVSTSVALHHFDFAF